MEQHTRAREQDAPHVGMQRLSMGYEEYLQYDDAEGRSSSPVLHGFWLRTVWLWHNPLPDPLTAFLEIRGISPHALQPLRDTPGGTT